MKMSHDWKLASRLPIDNPSTSGVRAAREVPDVEGYCYHDAMTRQAELGEVLPYGVQVPVCEARSEDRRASAQPAPSVETHRTSPRATDDIGGGNLVTSPRE
jgi:hypothetical protein